ncbi:extracellular catalytic domain type 1 short-chain-length polyhydroxyalkanoate depolymerase [Hydrocarboniphaga sp.]|uniref:extracellular catalytic domain type 1 short-chain-length polyhydroxyalkanoate depolymerase n=1 Tax=Hydrocarboniphaga sp. TaxID=2033016 RepID=UPI003D0CB6AB
MIAGVTDRRHRRPAAWRLLLALMAVFGTAVADDGGADRHTLRYRDVDRAYLLRLPAARLDRSRPLPLLIVLHGGGGNADNAERMTGFTPIARQQGFIVVYPEGSGRLKDRLLTWNAKHCCGYAMREKVDDVGFIDALIAQLSRDYPVDAHRIYATGMSNGAMMAHRLGAELPQRFAAIATVVGTVFGDEVVPKSPVSALMINGMLDHHVPYLGGPPGGPGARIGSWDGTPTQPALAQAAFWARADGCEPSPQQQDRGAVIVWSHRCPDGRAVELQLVKDNGHAWPGGERGSDRGDTPSTAIKASSVIWTFFAAHPR